MTHPDDETLLKVSRGHQPSAPAVAAHLRICPLCRAQVVVWNRLSQAARTAAEQAGPIAVPSFDTLIAPALSRLRTEPAVEVVSPGIGRSWRLAAAIATWQLRLLPRLLPVLLVVGLASGVAAAWTISQPGWAEQVFADVVALGALLAALGACTRRTDPRGELWQTLPISPGVVFLARLVLVLGADLVTALAASGLLAGAGHGPGFAGLVAAWLGPALLSAGAGLLLAVWRGAWLGGLVGGLLWLLGALASWPSAHTVNVGLGKVASQLWTTTPWTVLAGLLLLAAAAWLAGHIRTTGDFSPAM